VEWNKMWEWADTNGKMRKINNIWIKNIWNMTRNSLFCKGINMFHVRKFVIQS
jgi:hypothetical protein